MGYLDKLKQMVADDFARASENPASQQQIDHLAEMKVLVDNAIEENEKLLTEKDEENKKLLTEKTDILKAYSASVAHQSFKDSNTAPTNEIGPKPVTFEEVFLKNIK